MLIIATLIKNEIQQIPVIEDWLSSLLANIDTDIRAVFLDNGSTDGTVAALESIASEYPGKCFVSSDTEDFFEHEQRLRTRLWDKVKGLGPNEGDWVLVLDADEVPSDGALGLLIALGAGVPGEQLYKIMPNTMLVTLRLKELWAPGAYRYDGYWSPYFNRLFRFFDAPFCTSHKTGLHTSPLPEYLLGCATSQCLELDIIHTGYSAEAKRQAKSLRYLEHNTDSLGAEHADTILQPPLLRDTDGPLPTFAICSLVHDRRWALKQYLHCLSQLSAPIGTRVYFIANNCEPETLQMLQKFRRQNPNFIVEVEIYNFKLTKSKKNHEWPDDLLAHMSIMRNKCLEYGRKHALDAIISIDTDLVFDWAVINHLLRCDKDIISPVFWASWQAEEGYGRRMPQVWQKGGGEIGSSFVQMLKDQKRLTKVGGLGAFTKISKSVWEAGVNYDPVYNLGSDIRGEDRYFCIRAAVAGFQLWASTYHNVYHLDNPDILAQYQAIGVPLLCPE